MKVTFLVILIIGTMHAVTQFSANNSPLYYVHGLVKSWNEKHNQTGDVVVFNIGKKSYLSENAAKVIPGSIYLIRKKILKNSHANSDAT